MRRLIDPDIFISNIIKTRKGVTPEVGKELIKALPAIPSQKAPGRFHGDDNRPTYYNVPCAFDIETTNYISADGEIKGAFMYSWQFGLYGVNIIGRTWDQLLDFLTFIKSLFSLSEELRIVCLIHNIDYEYQFIRKRIKWTDFFATDLRRPLYTLSEYGIEFRCSYRLTNSSLDQVAKDLVYHRYAKKIKGFNYDKIRNSKTPLNSLEREYAVADVIIPQLLMAERIFNEPYGSIATLPLTKTGYIRRRGKNNTISNKDPKIRGDYRELMKKLKFIDLREYQYATNCYTGGYVHAAPLHAGNIIRGVGTYDKKSDYPYQCVANMLPMGLKEKIQGASMDYLESLKAYHWISRITLHNVKRKAGAPDAYLSYSKCKIEGSYQLYNGRVVNADKLQVYLNDVDWIIIKEFYTFDTEIETDYTYVYYKAYLPTPLVEVIVELFKAKELLKNDKTKAIEYALAKMDLNSIYGAMVTSLVNAIFEIDEAGDWIDPHKLTDEDIYNQIKKANNSRSRWLYYPWGVFVTSYSRLSTLSAVKAAGEYYLYSDTDSIKFMLDGESVVTPKIDKINKIIKERLDEALAHHNFNEETKRILSKLGQFTREPDYRFAKFYGAKRYCYINQDYSFGITIAGLPKYSGAEALVKKYGKWGAMAAMGDGMGLPAGSVKKLTHYYNDETIRALIVDEYGNEEVMEELSSVNLSPCSWYMSIDTDYLEFIDNFIYESFYDEQTFL